MSTFLVTGGNAGLGLACARSLAVDHGAGHVVLACRDLRRAQQAVDALRGAAPETRFTALELDLASLGSVRAFPARLRDAGVPALDGLVLNAGVQSFGRPEATADGFELTFGVNHLAHYLLTRLLLPSLAPRARVVVVASGTHDPRTTDGRFNPPRLRETRAVAWPDRGDTPEMSGIVRYTTSKLANVLFAYALHARRAALGRPDIAVLAYDPGAVPGTGLVRRWPAWVQWLWRTAMMRRLVARMGTLVSTVEDSGRAMARLAADAALDGESGTYFQVLRRRDSSLESHDTAKQDELWTASEALVGGLPV
jgi:NAD(P)-dependent dehydrogenase (short-subunit alcohol dehydrogenase family)